MSGQEILTVLIPTRDRADTLVHCLHTITAQSNPNIEIIVSDNFSGPEVKAVVDSVSDSRLRYIRTPERLGMSEHWNWATEQVKGDWLTIVGDDDGLIPGAVDKFFSMRAKHPEIKAITSANCWYRWPSDYQTGKGAKLCVMGSKGYEIRDCREYLKRCMEGEVISLPSVYTGGFMSMELFREIKERSPNRQFFQSIIPDVYSGMAMSSVTDKYIYSWEPWGIAGSSKHSNGRQHKDKTKAEMKNLDFHKENQMKFNPKLGDGCVEAIQILLYESFVQSSHLRSDDLGINLPQQLELSISHCAKRTRESVIEYCRDVARMNNVEFEPILKAANRQRALYRLQKLKRKVLRHIPGMSKLPRKVISDTSLKNVYDAAQKVGNLAA